MSKPDSFHSYRDGRGLGRRVFVNGNEVKRVRWCDTKAGVVVYIPWPARIKKPEGDEVYTPAFAAQSLSKMWSDPWPHPASPSPSESPGG